MADEGTEPVSDRVLLLEGDRVGLALMERADVPRIARWMQDLDFAARLGTPGEAHSREMREEFFERHARLRDDSAEFAVIERETGRLVGFGGLFGIGPALTGTLFLGIGEEADRGGGFGSDAVRLICTYGFFFRSLHAIKVEVHGFNGPALRLFRRAGFVPAGRLRGAHLLNGTRYDEVLMDLLRDEFDMSAAARFASLERSAD